MNSSPAPEPGSVPSIPRILSIAGTDPSGGAGIQADLKSIAAAGGYGMTVVTSLVAQNTQGVQSVFTPPSSFLNEQLKSVFDDIDVDAIKIGMLGTEETVKVVHSWLEKVSVKLTVLDPVMIASSGDRLLDENALAAVRELLPLVDIITPNLPELALLGGTDVATTLEDAVEQALAVARRFRVTVIAKGGHLVDDDAGNTVVKPDGTVQFVSSPRVHTKNTHGTGCSLSSALVTKAATGMDLYDALRWSTRWLREAIVYGASLQVGHGHGPVDHGHRSRRLEQAAMMEAQPLRALVDTAMLNTGSELFIEPVGPKTAALGEIMSSFLTQAKNSHFVRSMCDGSMKESDFRFYMEQDALFMENSFRTLTAISAKAPTPQSQIMWSSAAQDCLVRESDFHLAWLGMTQREVAEKVSPTPITAALMNFHAAQAYSKPYEVSVTAALAGSWIYAELANYAKGLIDPTHAYSEWCKNYSDEDSLETTRMALRLAEDTLADASDVNSYDAFRVFRHACHQELRFLRQPNQAW